MLISMTEIVFYFKQGAYTSRPCIASNTHAGFGCILPHYKMFLETKKSSSLYKTVFVGLMRKVSVTGQYLEEDF